MSTVWDAILSEHVYVRDDLAAVFRVRVSKYFVAVAAFQYASWTLVREQDRAAFDALVKADPNELDGAAAADELASLLGARVWAVMYGVHYSHDDLLAITARFASAIEVAEQHNRAHAASFCWEREQCESGAAWQLRDIEKRRDWSYEVVQMEIT